MRNHNGDAVHSELIPIHRRVTTFRPKLAHFFDDGKSFRAGDRLLGGVPIPVNKERAFALGADGDADSKPRWRGAKVLTNGVLYARYMRLPGIDLELLRATGLIALP